MSSTINGTSAATGTSNTSGTSTPKTTQTLGESDFLNLLTTQLENQDPMQPMDNTQSIAEMAQFSSLEQMSNIATSVNTLNTNMTNFLQQSALTQGAAMIGKSVSGLATDGVTTIKGIVNAVTVSSGTPQLQVLEDDGTTVSMALSQVTLVQDQAPATT
ncbi:MAG: flagellar hook capping FlgD N-terminal domain-containing protein [Desulfosporosinus sp.]|nr:flagellar hook capping FlgD N-terminal domain-containing protein [Desulfosporosinus sp.]